MISDFDRDEIPTIAESLDFRPDLATGQYFIGDPDVVRWIVSVCGVAEHDRVLVVGAGMGATTLALLAAGTWVTAVEVDQTLARHLPSTIALHTNSEIHRLIVLEKDVFDLRHDDAADEPSVLLISLPTELMTGAVLHLLTEVPSIRVVVAVAGSLLSHWQRFTPGTPGYDVAVARLRYLADVQYHAALPSSAFWPVPPWSPELFRLDRLD